MICDVFKVSRSCYYSWLNRAPLRKLKSDNVNMLEDVIKSEFNKSRKTYGSIKIANKLKKQGIFVNKTKVAKIMHDNGIKSISSSKYKVCTTDSNHKLPIYDNHLNRQFKAPSPNYAWCGDITYCHTDEGWLYLATVMDLYSNKIIGYATSTKIDKWLVVKALTNALRARNYPSGVIVHTDRGSQYCSKMYRMLISAHGLIGSMSRRGNCWDNAVAENFFGLIKREFLNHYSFSTVNRARLAIFDYINGWYNPHRIHSKLGYVSPDEFELNQLMIHNQHNSKKNSLTILPSKVVKCDKFEGVNS